MTKPAWAIRWALCTLFLLASSCGDGPRESFATKPQVDIDLPSIRERGVLNALVDNNSVSYFIYRGQPMGYEYELLQLFSKYLKVGLKITVISGVEEAIDRLNKGQGDLIAFPLTVTRERKKYMDFTEAHFTTSQVLVQLRPEGWRQNPAVAERELIRNPADLIGKEIHVMKQSAFKERLENLSDEVGGEIAIVEDSADAETESLIRRVANGEIQYTVADQMLAMVNATYYPNLDVNTVLSLPQQIAWAVRKNAPQLREATDQWIKQMKKKGTLRVIYDKYFNSPRTSVIRMNSDYSSLSGGKISVYDEWLKDGAGQLGWDWRLLAAIVSRESNFNPRVESWAGAIGLMQLMPDTGEQFDVDNLYDPRQNIRAGVLFLKHLDELWSRTIADQNERLKFVLASYNVGLSHVVDARNLAKKHGADPLVWDNQVEFYLLQKSKPQYYKDPVVAAGYCRCEGPVHYVKDVLARYEEYKTHIK
jgi:membrane-bound lytic murein transglycosylase F